MDIIENIEYELTTFIRRAVSMDSSDKRIGSLERAPYLLLRQLEEYGPARIRTLADEFKLDISTLSRQTALLESRGWIERTPDPDDRRASLLQISPAGRDMLFSDQRKRIRRYQEMLAEWTPEEREVFARLLSRLSGSLFP
ncbi:MarR family transcriptional regulator [Paenibacillus sp. JX-17]|uniref:MarR family transcriptional regulator n=1 Tax=Paenibacillus lacisoli TaxID=3064525 RepID=A0ABT9CKV8_9BACL|nr:MarR family transcriptional regulator [Paenibacillus sp. JX-17]MDO7908306.1 MarR family transcriptional regulator [Paenibacillus sp. JX-17]